MDQFLFIRRNADGAPVEVQELAVESVTVESDGVGPTRFRISGFLAPRREEGSDEPEMPTGADFLARFYTPELMGGPG